MVVVGSDLRYWRHGDEGPYNLDQKFVMEMLAMLASCLVCFITRMDIFPPYQLPRLYVCIILYRGQFR